MDPTRTNSARRTPLHGFHARLGAKMVDFAGWEMPLVYTSIFEEHHHTRQAASIFDVSHMGRIEVRGPDAERLLQRVCTRQLADMTAGQSRYSHICNETGGILDDIIVSRDEYHWLVVCNAGNRDRIVAWLRQHAEGHDVEINDTTESTLMVAVQGPQAIATLGAILPIEISDLGRYRGRSGTYMGLAYSVFRTGYTGEDGIELVLPAMVAGLLAGYLPDPRDAETTLKPAGLGARDTLRLEAGMPLHGHELTEHTDPISAGFEWCIDLQKDFIGAEALRGIYLAGPRRRLVGIELAGRRIARPHATVLDHGRPAGEVTSGTFAPTLARSIAMAYVDASLAEPGRRLTVDLGGKQAAATVVRLPFYKRDRKQGD